MIGPTAGEGWLEYIGVPDDYPHINELAREVDDATWEAALFVLEERKLEDPVLRAMADERCGLWTWTPVLAGAMRMGTRIIAKYGDHTEWYGRLVPLDFYERQRLEQGFRKPNELCVNWSGWIGGEGRWDRQPEVMTDTEVEARVPVPFDLSALLAAIERETGVVTRSPRRVRRRPDVERTCDSCGRKGTRGFQVVPPGNDWPGGTYCTGRTACRRRAYRLTPAAVRAQQRRALEVNA